VENAVGAVDTGGAVTVTERVTWFDPAEFAAVSVTEYAPPVAYVCGGFRSVDVPPSPKFHCQLVGFNVEVSVNAIDTFV
jgi:hypothetical protein